MVSENQEYTPTTATTGLLHLVKCGGFLWYNRCAYLENVIHLLINALPVAGLFCGIITAIEPEEEDL